MRVAEGAHQLTFPNKFGGYLVDFRGRYLGSSGLFSGVGGSRRGHLFNTTVCSSADNSTSGPHVWENERPQIRIVSKRVQ